MKLRFSKRPYGRLVIGDGGYVYGELVQPDSEVFWIFNCFETGVPDRWRFNHLAEARRELNEKITKR